MIVVGYNYRGQIISILNAKSLELAYTYWYGAKILPHSHKIIDLDAIENNGTGVIPILKTKEINTTMLDRKPENKLLVIDIL